MTKRYKIIVCGGRDYADWLCVERVLDEYLSMTPFIIQGGARGADALAAKWAKERGMPCATVEAHWDEFGHRAGPIRNDWMLDLDPDLVIAFPGGKGTASTVRRAIWRNYKVFQVSDSVGEEGSE